MTFSVLISLIFIFVFHYIADFWLQTERQATTKNKSIESLAKHCAVYSIPFLIFGWKFALATGLLHFITDYFTSKGTSYFWDRGQTRKMFQVIGFDQMIHKICLLVCFYVFVI